MISAHYGRLLGRTPFTPRCQKLVALAHRAVKEADAQFWLERVSDLSDEQFAKSVEAPLGRLSVVAATFTRQVLITNRKRLSDADESQN